MISHKAIQNLKKLTKMVAISLNYVGYFLPTINFKKMHNWKSKLFKVLEEHKCNLNATPDLYSWGYSDKLLEKCLPVFSESVDINVYILNVPLQDNHYSRIINRNRVVITYHQVKEILDEKSIPAENLLISLLYSYSLIYRIRLNDEMSMTDEVLLAHSESRGCLFDMCGIKNEIIHSCISPIICPDCMSKLKIGTNLNRRLSNDLLESSQQEIKKLKRGKCRHIIYLMKTQPLFSLLVSFLLAILASILVNLLTNCIFP